MKTNHERLVAAAIAHLREARTLLQGAGARRTLARVNLALSSAKGARRHAAHKDMHAERRAPIAQLPFE